MTAKPFKNQRYGFIVSAILLMLYPSVGFTEDKTCASPEGLHHEVISLKAQDAKTPHNGQTLLQLSTVYQALGMGEAALKYAQQAIDQLPKSGAAMVAKVHALHLLGKVDEAVKLGNTVYFDKSVNYTYSRGMKSWLRHSLLGIYLDSGKLDAAEKLIMTAFPEVLKLMDKPVEVGSTRLGTPLHTVEALIHILRKTGRTQSAERLAAHFKGFSVKSLFDVDESQLQGVQHWMLASIWAGVTENQSKVTPFLRKAYDKGFLMGWRFNYAYHPIYWPLHQNADFKALIQYIEADMARSKSCLAAV